MSTVKQLQERFSKPDLFFEVSQHFGKKAAYFEGKLKRVKKPDKTAYYTDMLCKYKEASRRAFALYFRYKYGYRKSTMQDYVAMKGLKARRKATFLASMLAANSHV